VTSSTRCDKCCGLLVMEQIVMEEFYQWKCLNCGRVRPCHKDGTLITKFIEARTCVVTKRNSKFKDKEPVL